MTASQRILRKNKTLTKLNTLGTNNKKQAKIPNKIKPLSKKTN